MIILCLDACLIFSMLQPLVFGHVFKFELVHEETFSLFIIKFLENDLAYSCERPEVGSDNHWLTYVTV